MVFKAPIGHTGRPGPPGPQGIQGEPGDTVLNREEFDRVSKATAKKLNKSIIMIADLMKDIRQLNDRVSYLEQLPTNESVTPGPMEAIRTSNNTLHHNISERTCTLCGITSTNWRRIAYFDTTRGDPCPPGLRTFTNTTTGQRACGTTDEGQQQTSLNFTTGGSYIHVCGRVRGYQGDNVVAFFHHGQVIQTIDTNYVDGVSITRGTPRQHLWTYAAGISETWNADKLSCPCARSGYNPSWIPSFVGTYYYCESGFVGAQLHRIIWEDPLWDGKGCFTSGNTCCDRYGWFHRQVPSTTDDIEVRWSKYYSSRYGSEILTDQLEIWVM